MTVSEQLELLLQDWRTLSSAPNDSRWIEMELQDRKIVRAHYACDLSGSDQPPFKGWFYDAGGYFYEVWPKPVRWRPLMGGSTQ